jgi:hypothetical protein
MAVVNELVAYDIKTIVNIFTRKIKLCVTKKSLVCSKRLENRV